MRDRVGLVILGCSLAVIASSCGGNSSQQESAASQYQQLSKVSAPETPAPPPAAAPAPLTPAASALMPELGAPAPAPAATPAPAAASSPAAEPAPAPAAASAPAPAPKELESHDANLAANGGADAKDETGRPRGWVVNPAEIIAKPSGEAVQGPDFLALKSVKERQGIIAIPVMLKPEDVGKPLRVEAWGKAPAANTMTLALGYKDNGEDKMESRIFWEKSPKAWSKLEFVATVPATADLSTVKVLITIPQKAGQDFAIDDVRVSRDLLGPNASLELLDDSGRPRGWSASPADFVTKEKVKAFDGVKALGLKGSAEMRGYIGHPVDLAPEDLGHKLQVSAWGQAETPDVLTLAVYAGDKQLGFKTWPATAGEWKQGVLEVDLPKDADPKSIQVQVSVREKAEGKYAVDLVQASVQ